MDEEFLSPDQAEEIVGKYLEHEGDISSTQEILDSGVIPRLKGYVVRPGKVSDSIFGGKGSFKNKSGERIEFENPQLLARDGAPLRIMVRTDRISTHDINRGSIPFKDQILALNHNYMRKMVAPFIGTSQLEVPGLADNSVVIAAEDLKQLGFEMVLRDFMAKSSTSTSLFQHYMKGERVFCGHKLPEGLIPNGSLPYIMDTPSTKSEEHDESLAPEEMFKRGICTLEQYSMIKEGALKAFSEVSWFLGDKGIIIADTKTEHGINKYGKIVSQDELFTMDSSRFWLREDYNQQMQLLNEGKITELNPKSYSKEFARGFSEGEKGYTSEQRAAIAVRYIEGIQNLLGMRFAPNMEPRDGRVISGLQKIVEEVIAV
jgi:phosphoribosylaminoimidazole-succinocarboxamide synthase